MTTITREQQKQILIDTANHVISRDNTSPHSENLRELARIALASLEAEPIGAFHIVDQQVGGTSDYIKGGEWPIDNGVIDVYSAPPVQETGIYKDMLNIIGLLENNEWAEHCTSTVLGSLLESEITRLVGKEQPAPVVPVGLRMALSNAGIAAPESDEMLAATHEKYIQALVTWVKDRKPFQPAQVVPEEMPKGLAGQIVSLLAHNIGDKFLAQKIWNACRNAMLNGDTFRENSISSTNNVREIAETSTNSPVIPDGSEDTKRLDWLDAQNKRLNEYYGTAYGWKFDANFQRNAMMLNDSNYPVMTVRQAIDKAIAAAPQQETNN